MFENFKNTYFEDPLLVLRKTVLDGKRDDWATNAFNWKFEPHEISLCNIQVIFILTE